MSPNPGNEEYWREIHEKMEDIPPAPHVALETEDRMSVDEKTMDEYDKYKVAEGFYAHAWEEYRTGKRTDEKYESTIQALNKATYQMYAAQYRAMADLGLASQAKLPDSDFAAAARLSSTSSHGRASSSPAASSSTAAPRHDRAANRGR